MDQQTITALAVILFVVYPCVICCLLMMGPRRVVNFFLVADASWPDDSVFVNLFSWTMTGPITAHILLNMAEELARPRESTVTPSAVSVAGAV